MDEWTVFRMTDKALDNLTITKRETMTTQTHQHTFTQKEKLWFQNWSLS